MSFGVGAEIDRDYLTTLRRHDQAGGLFEAVAPADIPTIYQSLEELLRGQYIVTFTSQAPPETQNPADRDSDSGGRAERLGLCVNI